ncbi:hypothetical protein M9H77_08291 [Catharanthus roseus]|uniref:Uncharacterized protein n=1 Tax=Catharanthus roseus TaxID=4058 RepID=A0ACC0BXD5_CATRO|nr:hypothetical protein M9H77_08291 [Catharanthus roseus]
MWSSSSNRQINYGIASEMGMVGHLRDVFLVTPATTTTATNFHHHQEPTSTINFDPHHSINGSNSSAIGVNVIPLLTPCLAQPNVGVDEDLLLNNNRSNNRGGCAIQFWQNQTQPNQRVSNSNFKKPSILDHSCREIGSGSSINSASTSTTTCQDCGNQAKKDCSHRRCRTCCKSRGFDCSTHVKSTWVPAARRRERQLMVSAGPAAVTAGSTQSISSSKKPKLSSQTPTASRTSTSNTTPPRSFDTGSSHQDASFKETLPGQVRAPAVFKCVRVTSVDDGEDEYAYQAMVRIGGHVFKGFLYDQGVEGRDGSSSFPNISDLHLGGGGRNGGASSSSQAAAVAAAAMIDPSDVYAAGLLGGSSNYGNQIN